VTCPAGITRQVTARNTVIFGVACRGCPLRARCTTAKADRTVHLHEHDSLLRAARADRTAGPELRQDYMAHGPTSSAPSPRSPPGGDAGSSSATTDCPGTTPGSSAGPPR
jgi:Transposase DDE domain